MNTREYTETILAENPLYRNNDTELLIRVLREQGVIEDDLHAERFRQMQFDLWDIRRNRQKIQEEGLYTATQEVRMHRKKREAVEHIKHSKKQFKKKLHIDPNWRNKTWIDQQGRSFTI